MIIDTHTHIYLPEFEDPDAAVERALAAGKKKQTHQGYHQVLPGNE